MGKYKRTNFLIDKPFQLGFILRYLLVIILTVAFCFLLTVGYFYYRSLFGENILNEVVIIQKRSSTTKEGYKKYAYDDEKIILYKIKTKNKEKPYEYRVYDTMGQDKYHKNDVVEVPDEKTKLRPYFSGEQIRTNVFYVVLPPLLILCLAIMIIISVYSLFFSHKMAGPIYRIRISLEQMINGDGEDALDFGERGIRVREGDFFINIVELLDRFRRKVKNNEYSPNFPYEKINELKALVKDGADKDEILKKINELKS